jgi:hypothetical protein
MPKFLAGCHYNEEEISRHLKKKYRIWAGPNEWQQVCNRSNPEETGRSCEGADFSWLIELKSPLNPVSNLGRWRLADMILSVRCKYHDRPGGGCPSMSYRNLILSNI